MPEIDSVLEFQVTEWNPYHEIENYKKIRRSVSDDSDDSDSEDAPQLVDKYAIQMFGRTADDKDVCIKVTDFHPYFYVEIPKTWGSFQITKFIEHIKMKVKSRTRGNPNYNFDVSSSLLSNKTVYRRRFYNFYGKEQFKFLKLEFLSQTGMREYSNTLMRRHHIFGVTNGETHFQRYESNIEPHIRFMHINNLSTCGWASIAKDKLKPLRGYSNCDHCYAVDWHDVKPSANDDRMAPFKIMGYDIECISCDENFPQASRKSDKIIQIGNTMYRYGSMNCYEQHILTLKKCSNIKGVNVQCYKTEKGLLKGWAQLVNKLRPDFISGYNTFGFDDKYIFDRVRRIDQEAAAKRGCTVDELENRFADEFLEILGKVNNRWLMENEGLTSSQTKFIKKDLSSSALGDNELNFFGMTGIVTIDMMKIIQRDHRLGGYKLDNVSANFINESATKVTDNAGVKITESDETEETSESEDEDELVGIEIYTKSTKALEPDSYIQIMVDDSYSSSPLRENAKYYVDEIYTRQDVNSDGKPFSIQCIKTKISRRDVKELRSTILNPLLKIYWTFAKDDMHHTKINSHFAEGDPKMIRQIAKYCLKDCKLVNLLLAKLDIIVNSVAMAKVCHVPLSYIFLRGQGVKIFSLVSKKCREKGFLIPVLSKKNSDIDGDSDESYEGATVITPKPAVYISPISVLDFSSLYPNSMREKNLTQECYVADKNYDNLPGYIYHDVYIKMKDAKGRVMRNFDNTPVEVHHRYAQELISDEEIAKELSEIFAKINQTTKTAINLLKTQNSLTERNLVELVKYYEALVETTQDKSARRKLADLQEVVEELDPHLKAIKAGTDVAKSAKRVQQLLASIPYTDDLISILIKLEEKSCTDKIAMEKNKRYNTVNGKTVKYGILPEILTELLNKRKETNARLASETDPFLKSILNALQLAFKITANSLYGQTGAPTSPIFFIAIAASTTAVGRERLYLAKKIVEDNFEGAEIIYGDSVTANTPIITKDPDGKIAITSMKDLNNEWNEYNAFKAGESNRREKQQSHVNQMVWTRSGWAKIKRVIRHKTFKKIYQITTDTGVIECTEDHSLLTNTCDIIKPAHCDTNINLLHRFAPHVSSQTMSYSDAIEMGMNYDSNKLIDNRILNSELNVKGAFLGGYHHLHETFSSTNPLAAQGFYFLVRTMGYHTKIKVDDNGTYWIEYDSVPQTDNATKIRNIKFLRYTDEEEYVYDLETTDGTFQAGVGELVIKNTDSIFINFHFKDANGNEMTDRAALIKSIAAAKQAAKLINAAVPKPQAIVYEKTLHPFILAAKKKYVGLLFEEDPDSYYIKSMGIVLKRRDNPPIVKIVVGGIIDHILKNRDVDGAIRNTREILTRVMRGEYPMDKFVISKTLKSKYKKPQSIAHKVLADRMALRDPGNKPQTNDRIPFVYIYKKAPISKNKKILQGDLIETPEFIKKNNLEIDYLYYLEHQIIEPASQILALMIHKKAIAKFFNEFIVKEQNRRKGCQNIAKFAIGTTTQCPTSSDLGFEISKEMLAKKSKGVEIAKPETVMRRKNNNDPRDKVLYVGNTKKIVCQNIGNWAVKNDEEDSDAMSFD